MKQSIIFLFSFFALIFASCPDGSIKLQNSCYFFYPNATTFPNAELTCNNLTNGHLASVHDGFTNALITAQAANNFHEITDTNFWIGLNSLLIPGNWSWTDNSTFDFKDWSPTEPQNLKMSCGTVTISNGYWASDDCFKQKPFVCEIPYESYPIYMNCSYGYIYFEPTHSCYGLSIYDTYPANWTRAKAFCEYQNAHLVSLHSYEETKFVSTLNGGNFHWTGLTSNDNGITWQWSDGSTVDYLPWFSESLDLSNPSCTVLYAEKIYYINSCNETVLTICKKPAMP